MQIIDDIFFSIILECYNNYYSEKYNCNVIGIFITTIYITIIHVTVFYYNNNFYITITTTANKANNNTVSCLHTCHYVGQSIHTVTFSVLVSLRNPTPESKSICTLLPAMLCFCLINLLYITACHAVCLHANPLDLFSS